MSATSMSSYLSDYSNLDMAVVEYCKSQGKNERDLYEHGVLKTEYYKIFADALINSKELIKLDSSNLTLIIELEEKISPTDAWKAHQICQVAQKALMENKTPSIAGVTQPKDREITAPFDFKSLSLAYIVYWFKQMFSNSPASIEECEYFQEARIEINALHYYALAVRDPKLAPQGYHQVKNLMQKCLVLARLDWKRHKENYTISSMQGYSVKQREVLKKGGAIDYRTSVSFGSPGENKSILHKLYVCKHPEVIMKGLLNCIPHSVTSLEQFPTKWPLNDKGKRLQDNLIEAVETLEKIDNFDDLSNRLIEKNSPFTWTIPTSLNDCKKYVETAKSWFTGIQGKNSQEIQAFIKCDAAASNIKRDGVSRLEKMQQKIESTIDQAATAVMNFITGKTEELKIKGSILDEALDEAQAKFDEAACAIGRALGWYEGGEKK